jgi:hypothetical protein
VTLASVSYFQKRGSKLPHQQEDKNPLSVKPNKGVRFYNPGDRITEPINYSLPGMGDIHCVARWVVEAEEKSFFQVPTELRLMVDGTKLSVDFPETVLQRFKNRGVIMIDDEWEPSGDEDYNERMPIARNEDEAYEKGAARWRKYLESIVRAHVETCGRARAQGGFPIEAQGFTKRAFKLLNMHDPASIAFAEAMKTYVAPSGEAQNAEVVQMKAELDETKQMLAKVLRMLEAKEATKDDDVILAAATGASARGRGRPKAS